MRVGEALFEVGSLRGITWTGEDRVVMREGVGSDVLGDLGEGLDGAVEAQAATEEEEAETGVEALEELYFVTSDLKYPRPNRDVGGAEDNFVRLC